MPELPRTFGPYVLLSSLGKGAAGEAFLARPHDDRVGIPTPVVIKCLHQRLAESEEFVKRFRHEAEIAVRVASRHVAAVYDVGAVGDSLYIALDYVPGFTGSRLLSRLVKRKAQPPIPVATAFVIQCLTGLYDLFSATDREGRPLEVVHRDVSPKNIMVGDDGVVRVIDLGLGKSKAQDWKTRDGRVMGSPGYMAPEQIRGEEVDHRADVYAMGVILHEILTVRRFIPKGDPVSMLRAGLKTPFVPPSRFRPEVSSDLDRIVERALAPDRDARFETAREMMRALEEVAPAAPEQDVARFVGHLLGGEAEHRRSEVDRLLSLTFAPPDGPELAKTVVFTRRSGVLPMEAEAEEPGPSEESRVETMPMQSLSPASIRVIRASAPSRWPMVLLVLFALLIGLGGGIIIGTRSAGEAVVVEPSPPPVPSVSAAPQVEEDPPRVSASPKVEEVPPPPVEKVPLPPAGKVPPTRRVRARPRPTPPPPAPPPVAPPASPPSPDEALAGLQRRATELKRSLADQDPRQKALTVFLRDLSMTKAAVRRDAPDAPAKVRALTARLQALEE